MPKYHLKRKDKELTDAFEINAILKNGRYTTLSMCRNDEPYIVTMNYGYDETRRSLYFHCALEGLKLEFIESNPDVCGTIIDDLGYVKGECDHHYKSLVFRGKISVVDDAGEKRHGLNVLIEHHEEHPDEAKAKLIKDDKTCDKCNILRLDIEEITAKQAI